MMVLDSIVAGKLNGFVSVAKGLVRPEDMTDAQLLELFRTEKDPVKLIGPVAVWRSRKGLSPHWYPEEVIANALEGIVPPRASNGVWVRSILRDKTLVLTLRDYIAWARGEITLPKAISREQACANIRLQLHSTIGDAVYQWSDEEVYMYAKDTTLPERTKRGSFKHSPLRDIRPPAQWQDNELVDAVEGLITVPKDYSLDQVYAESRKRWRLPAAWTNEQVKDYLINELTPEMNEDGVWVTDITRKNKPFKCWSDAELIAWVRGDIELEGRLRPLGAYNEIRFRYHYPDDMTNEEIHNDILANGLSVVSRPAEYLESDINHFVRIMSSVGATNEQRKFAHIRMWKSLRRTMRHDIVVFTHVWDQLLDKAATEYKLFSSDRVFRSIHEMNITQRYNGIYQLLLVLIADTALDNLRFARGEEGFYTLFEELRDVDTEAKFREYYGL